MHLETKNQEYMEEELEKIDYKFIELDQSLGNLYAVGTSILGFTPGEDEYKVMGLASYGGDFREKSIFL